MLLVNKKGAKVSAKDKASLQKKADDFNKRYKEKLGYGITVGMLASVFQRGLGAFNTSHSPDHVIFKKRKITLTVGTCES